LINELAMPMQATGLQGIEDGIRGPNLLTGGIEIINTHMPLTTA
jgi:hypothetical protein